MSSPPPCLCTDSLSAFFFVGLLPFLPPAYAQIDGVVSCLASRSGTKSDSWAIDYQATRNTLEAAKNEKAAHFVMLSAFCVKKPTLQARDNYYS